MRALKHTHKYVRLNSRPGHWKCDYPDCSHFAPYDLVVGKASICNKCLGPILALTTEQLKRSKPRCINCMNTKEAIEFKRRREFLDSLFAESEIPK